MTLYELKLKIKPIEKQQIIDAFGLDYLKESSDRDTFFVTEKDKPKEKIKESEGHVVHYLINFQNDSGLFEISNNEITENYNKIDEFTERTKSVKFDRTKEVYVWPGKQVRCAFDYITEIKNAIFFEIYGNDQNLVYAGKKQLIEMGFTKFEKKTYDDIILERKSIFKSILFWIILVVFVGIVLMIFFNW